MGAGLPAGPGRASLGGLAIDPHALTLITHPTFNNTFMLTDGGGDLLHNARDTLIPPLMMAGGACGREERGEGPYGCPSIHQPASHAKGARVRSVEFEACACHHGRVSTRASPPSSPSPPIGFASGRDSLLYHPPALQHSPTF